MCDARKCLDRLDLGVDNEKIVLPQEGALVFWGSRVNVGRWGKNSFLLAHNTNRCTLSTAFSAKFNSLCSAAIVRNLENEQLEPDPIQSALRVQSVKARGY